MKMFYKLKRVERVINKEAKVLRRNNFNKGLKKTQKIKLNSIKQTPN